MCHIQEYRVHACAHSFIFNVFGDFSRQNVSRIVTFIIRKFLLCVFEQPKQNKPKFTGSIIFIPVLAYYFTLLIFNKARFWIHQTHIRIENGFWQKEITFRTLLKFIMKIEKKYIFSYRSRFRCSCDL